MNNSLADKFDGCRYRISMVYWIDKTYYLLKDTTLNAVITEAIKYDELDKFCDCLNKDYILYGRVVREWLFEGFEK